MIKPAICYKEELDKALAEYFYTDDMMFYTGCLDSCLLDIKRSGEDGYYQYAVVGKDNSLIGYIAYRVDYYSSCVYNFGAFSFDRGNPVMGKELFDLLERCVNTYHRVAFMAVEGNPATRGYDKFLARHSDIGRKIMFRDVFKDVRGNYRDTYTYEFVNKLEGMQDDRTD